MATINKKSKEFYLEPPEIKGINSKTDIWVEEDDFYCEVLSKGSSSDKSERGAKGPPVDYIVVGFDTEFKTPDIALTREQIASGMGKYKVLSYQFYAKTHVNGLEWSGICCPENNERISIKEFLILLYGTAARQYQFKQLPTTIYLVGHFTRADLPAFSDFKDHLSYLSNLRNTFVSGNKPILVQLFDDDNPESTDFYNSVEIKIILRDTMLLTPQTSKNLAGIGDLLNIPKVELSSDKNEAKFLISNMDKLRKDNWPLFKKYAINDALICVRYMERIIELYKNITGKKKIPTTLTSIGIDLLLMRWKSDFKESALDILGKEEIKIPVFNKRLGYFIRSKKIVLKSIPYHYVNFAIETYHGGRNEQFWFGPCFEDDWIDYDLSGAYPTAMSLIGMPDWDNIIHTKKLSDFTPTSLGCALVEFEFPKNTRYPSLPVRTPYGLIFPLKGLSYCGSPELIVAKNLGAKLKILNGLIVPTDSSKSIFGEFIKFCTEKRKEAGSKSLTGLFWKEISNSTYGKTAQGLQIKRVFDISTLETAPLPESRITNAYFASFITSFIRALLGEIMNSVDESTCIFSCTTDGFLTNAKESEMERAKSGNLAQIFMAARKKIVNESSLLEIKHRVKKPLGWKTRGQATLKPSEARDDFSHYILAKGGIKIPGDARSIQDQNDAVVDLFFKRKPDQLINIESLTGMRDIIFYDSDLVAKQFDKHLNMEFDWKRRPKSLGISKTYNHILFSTLPWLNQEQFLAIREAQQILTKDEHRSCMKTFEDFDEFANYIECTTGLDKSVSRYLSKESGDLKRLRQSICAAWKQEKAGFTKNDGFLTAQQFSDFLNELGIPCKKTDVENAKKKKFIDHHVPATSRVTNILKKLKHSFKNLRIEDILFFDESYDAIKINNFKDCSFVSRVD
jgi:hypothetical protein